MADQPQKATLGLPNRDPVPPPALAGADVVYVPSHGDNSETTWRGYRFKAGEANRITDPEMIAAARSNPFFRVGSEPAAVDQNAVPTNPAGYRAHVVKWLKDIRSTEDLVRQWVADRNLRASCDVGSDDTNYLGPLLDQKVTRLALDEGLNGQQVAQIWVQHGVFELPWRK